MDEQKARHTQMELQYHSVFAPKNRRPNCPFLLTGTRIHLGIVVVLACIFVSYFFALEIRAR